MLPISLPARRPVGHLGIRHERREGRIIDAAQQEKGGVIGLVARSRSGDGSAEAELFSAVYDELHAVAEQLMRSERPGHTLQPTALVHEAFIRLELGDTDVNDRVHLLKLASRVMRRFLIDHARGRGRAKRGGGVWHVTLDPEHARAAADPLDLEAFDRVLTRLEALDPQMAEFVQLRYFAGLSNEDIAEASGVSARTVKRRLKMARAWIRGELERV